MEEHKFSWHIAYPTTISAKYLDFEISLTFAEQESLRQNRLCYDYSVITPTGVLFENCIFLGSRKYTTNDVLNEVLFFVCLSPGDTDEEFFKDYTEEQLAWASSVDCEMALTEIDEDF